MLRYILNVKITVFGCFRVKEELDWLQKCMGRTFLPLKSSIPYESIAKYLLFHATLYVLHFQFIFVNIRFMLSGAPSLYFSVCKA